MKRISTTISSLAILMLLPLSAYATVRGTITNTRSARVVGATVTFIQEDHPENMISGVTDSNGQYSINLSVGVDNIIPQTFTLGQNYPNPFNPTTTIPFSLDKSGDIRLDVFNITGQHIQTLADGYYNAGSHHVVWDARDKSSNHVSAGIYFYRLRSGRTIQSNKMLLLDGGGGSGAGGLIPIAKVAKTSTVTWSVEITGDEIESYTESGINLTMNGIYNYVVNILLTPDEMAIIESISLVTIPGGTFRMGDLSGDGDINAPVHTVTLSSFEMAATEITQSQYQAVTGVFPKDYKGGNYPVVYVTRRNAIDFCNMLSDIMGYELCYNATTKECDFSKNGFRLPTEAEWEYACRAGTETKYYWGDSDADSLMKQFCWYNKNAYEYHWTIPHAENRGTQPVATKLPNDYGLYDMSGNVSEWCNGMYSDDYFPSTSTNPTGPSTGTHGLVRGGSWFQETNRCLSAMRIAWYIAEPRGFGYLGFRVVRSPDGMIPDGGL